MKSVLLSLLLLSFIFVFTTSENYVQENRLIGTWKLASGTNNGVSVPMVISDRIQTFGQNQIFESKINTSNGLKHANGGLYYVLNDSTLITFHKEMNGKLSKIGNTYFFHIKNETLHLYGCYLAESKDNPSVLQKVYIDEKWIRTASK